MRELLRRLWRSDPGPRTLDEALGTAIPVDALGAETMVALLQRSRDRLLLHPAFPPAYFLVRDAKGRISRDAVRIANAALLEASHLVSSPHLFDSRAETGRREVRLAATEPGGVFAEHRVAIRFDDGRASVLDATGDPASLFPLRSPFATHRPRHLAPLHGDLLPREREDLELALTRLDEVPATDGRSGLDGRGSFLVEQLDRGRYCAAVRWSPEPGAFLDVCQTLSALAGTVLSRPV